MSFSHNVNSLSCHPFLAPFYLTPAVTLILTESRPLSFTKLKWWTQQLNCKDTNDFDIVVEVFRVDTRQQVCLECGIYCCQVSFSDSFFEKIVDLYVELNRAQPVLEIDVPDVIATSRKRIIDEACAALNKVSSD
jgi:hypothetical protein